MLEQYLLKPGTVGRIRNCWLCEPIERYVARLAENSQAPRNVGARYRF